jgi:PAS domain S-box-containing protein
MQPLDPLESVLLSIVDNTMAVIYVKRADGHYLFVNRRYENLLHVTRSELLGKTDYDIFSKEQADVFRANDLRVLEEDRAIELDEEVTQDDGLHRYISLKFPLRDQAGRGYAVCGISTDVTPRKQTEDQLRRSLSLLEASLESTADGLLVVDRTHRIVRFNRRFAELWQLPDEILAAHDDDAAIAYVLDQLVEPETFVAKVRSLYARPEASSFDTLAFKNGRVFERYSQPQFLGGEIVGRVWSFRDVSARVRAEQHRDRLLADEHQARTVAEEAVRLRDDFLSVASHELKTPLASLTLVVQVLEQRFEALEMEKVRRSVTRAGRQVERLSHLIDTLLDVSRIQAGTFELYREIVDLSAIAREVVNALADEAARLKTTVTLVCDGPVLGAWDGLRLEQAVTNLLSNALKFGDGRPVEVTVSANGHTARLCVRDHGIGIPKQVQGHLFERFSRGVSARHYGGLGLGLYITRMVVEAHEGHIGVISEEGRGSMFTVDLPIQGTCRADLGESTAHD